MTHPSPSTAIITGGAKRLGRTLALLLADSGYTIALHYNASKKEAEETRDEINAKGATCELYQADLGDISCTAPLIETICKDHPNTNLLIHNASIFEKADFLDTNPALFDRHMTVNFSAPFFLTQAFANHVKTGQVLTIADTYITKDTTAYFAYLLSKKALAEFTRMAARSLGPSIRVNAIAPGTTGMSKNVDEAYLEKKGASLPLKTLTTFDAIARTALDVIDNPHLTGQCIFVDSGEQLT